MVEKSSLYGDLLSEILENDIINFYWNCVNCKEDVCRIVIDNGIERNILMVNFFFLISKVGYFVYDYIDVDKVE